MGAGFSKLFPLIWDSILPSDYSTYQKSFHSGIVIALVGRSGSGMSRFIHDATGSYETGVTPEEWRGTNNKPYTAVIQDFGFTIPGIDYADFPLLFIDTPGFDYAANNDEHTALQKLLSWLQTCKPGMKLDGLIFMHNANADELQSRSPYVPRDKVMRELCGENWQGKVLFLSTHWHSLDHEHKKSKEAAIRKYWSHANSKTERYDIPGYESAWNILKPLIQKATAAREQRLEAELKDLKIQVGLEDGVCDRIRDILDKKMSFMRRVTTNLGTLTTQSLTDAEKLEYVRLNEKARKLWEEVEHEISGVELERLLTVGGNQESSDETIKVAYVIFSVYS
ncbi:hypothetical protein P691DRAFT_471479 [Macrolepiota fuliginosa MF-IS2]|uniref:G domain-containing protein n=1 Tax=Macrolepiota fuliginosa MF-IS2 TaxID=1400762 RepID=A0A9P5XIW0_9AGAR|nr:hypothetical protein P691DRAFT_471479 [Macrolepiota fuliginosa MF-IS2]